MLEIANASYVHLTTSPYFNPQMDPFFYDLVYQFVYGCRIDGEYIRRIYLSYKC